MMQRFYDLYMKVVIYVSSVNKQAFDVKAHDSKNNTLTPAFINY